MNSKRYAVEQDSPDGGRSTYAECWGAGGVRGSILSEHDTLSDAIRAASASAYSGYPDSCTWIWDRLAAAYVPASHIRRAGGRSSVHYPGAGR